MLRSEEWWYAVSTRYGGRGGDPWDDGLYRRVKEISLPSGCMSRSEERRYVVSTRYGPYGGRGGDHWDDGLYHRVKEITLRCGKCIDSFRVLYDKDNEQIQARAHGGNGGRVTTITFGSNEFLTTVSGHYGVADWTSGKEVVIRSIKFETNKTVYGPYGEELGSDRFNLTVKDGDKIIGFFGRSGKYLDAIGFHVETHP